ncbi:hypothetical protein QUW63_14255 [Pseudoflavonifractor phocaeensis]|uniref:hypothetical protein n=1 Tax=Pseudoflavonifractor phocaeensis TaxID=1870988 RepID=UPI0025A37292|nr:hypothetical protein [Pseudoflavonifractor phocaeensis]MDM8240248.1 hypothetical protein [Pseudoflavonifractor phocaeensis]
MEPKLRTVNKATPPYPLNQFPGKFIEKFGAEIVYMQATKETMSLEGNEWEQIFAACVGAKWKPSNVGLDDVILNNCCWGAKTVYSSSKKLEKQKKVRLICGRNSPIYSFGEEDIATNADPNHIGELVLDIWNERVSAVRQIYKFARTVVLVKSKDFSDFLIFETDTIRYDPDLYEFKWNKRDNLEGYEKSTGKHKFTWQPHGSQFTIIEEIPKDRLHLQVKKPSKLDKETVLKSVGYGKEWVYIFDD